MRRELLWSSDQHSLHKVADYKPFIFVDGEGVRCSLYVSGCLFACEGCFNKAIQNFNYGVDYTEELENRIIEDLKKPEVQGLTLLGGEPFLNTKVCLQLVRRMRAECGAEKDVWAWSGYTIEELLMGTPDKWELLKEVDILVDGRFEISQRDLTIPFRGSRNQRIIDVPESLRLGRAVEVERYRIN